jgi:hypothetical protein
MDLFMSEALSCSVERVRSRMSTMAVELQTPYRFIQSPPPRVEYVRREAEQGFRLALQASGWAEGAQLNTDSFDQCISQLLMNSSDHPSRGGGSMGGTDTVAGGSMGGTANSFSLSGMLPAIDESLRGDQGYSPINTGSASY